MKNMLLLFILAIGVNLTAQTTRTVVKKIEKTETTSSNSIDKNSKRLFNIEKEIVNGKERLKYKLVIDEAGTQKVIKWNGEGEMPSEIAEELARMENEEVVSERHEEHEVIIEKSTNGDKKVMVWKGEGEMPKEMKEILEEEGNVERIRIIEDDGETKILKIESDDQPYDISVKIGVGLSSDNNGVIVDEVMSGTAAEKAGFEVGDVILKLDDTYIFNYDKVMEFLSTKSAGDRVKAKILRSGKEKKLKLTLDAK